jgi:hypothetical protein
MSEKSCLSSQRRCPRSLTLADFALGRYNPMRVRTLSTLFVGAIFIALGSSAPAQTTSRKSWSLPQGTSVKDNGPRTYRFTVDYNAGNNKSEIIKRQRLTGEYTRPTGRKSCEERSPGRSGRPYRSPSRAGRLRRFRSQRSRRHHEAECLMCSTHRGLWGKCFGTE